MADESKLEDPAANKAAVAEVIAEAKKVPTKATQAESDNEDEAEDDHVKEDRPEGREPARHLAVERGGVNRHVLSSSGRPRPGEDRGGTVWQWVV